MIFILLVLCIVEFQLAACCTYGPECRFPCRCETGGCDPVTGTCTAVGCAEVLPSGYGYGWKGAGCRIGNIAYNKNTSQLGSWEGHTSDRAVDGNTDPDIDNGSCAHPITAPPNTAWWMVDLGKKHVIQEVVIFNSGRGQYRTNDFDIRIGMTSTIDDQDLCVFYNDGAKAVLTLTCTENVTAGRYVSMRRRWRSTDTDFEIINICEFVVIGYEPIECNNQCSGSCDDLRGCDTCDAGFKLPDCIDECNSGTWGEDCKNPCGQCADDQPCDKEDGVCKDGCQLWYMDTKCDVYIDSPTMETSAVNSEMTSSSSVTVRWQQYTIIHVWLAEYYFYRVKYGPTGRTKRLSIKRIPDLNADDLYLELSGLHYNLEYELQVIPYRIQGAIEEMGTPSKVIVGKRQCKGPSEPFMNVTTNIDTWTIYFTPTPNIASGCDAITNYTLYIAHETSIVHILSLLNDSTGMVNLPFKYVYVEASVWIEAINNYMISSNSKKGILFMSSSTLATTTQTTLNATVATTTQTTLNVLIVGCVIGVFGFAALVIGIVLTVRRGKLCAQKNTNRNTEMTSAYENAKTFNDEHDERNDIEHVSPDYENTEHPSKHHTDSVDQIASGNIDYEAQQTCNPYETLDVKDRDVTPTVYQTVK